MPKIYNCNICDELFNKKNDYIKHYNDIHKVVKNRENLSTIFNYCLEILRDCEHITCIKALKTLSYLLVLRLLENQFNNQIDIDNYEYDFNMYEEDIIEEHKIKLLKMARFSNLAKEKEENIPRIMRCLWDEILSVHPITKNIFLKGKGLEIQHQTTYKKLIEKLSKFNFEDIDEDILGEVYEEVIKNVMTGKILGQYFTPPKIKEMMIKLINPQLKDDGTIEKIFDPAMGTGGFLISSLRYILEQAKIKDISLNWNFIRNEGLGGREPEIDTYQLAISNMLISSGYMFNVLEKGDSLRDPIINKYDIILTNPPFGIDGLVYDDILNPLKNEYMPIKSNSAVSLFLQAVIYMLKINGRCAIVLPNGKELYSKNNTLINIRQYLMKTCDLKEIIYLPSGIFTNTSIKTCILYFIKKTEGNIQYKLNKSHQTNKVKFYNYNIENEEKDLLLELEINTIINNKYSLNYVEYLKNNIYKDNIVSREINYFLIKSISELCIFLPKSKRSAKYGNNVGLYPFFKSSLKVDKYIDIPDYNEESLIIGDGGEPNVNYGVKFSASDHCYILQNKDKSLLNLKYLYYYLYYNLDIMKQLYIGVGIKNISKANINSLKIPIPSIEEQKEIVEYCDNIEIENKRLNDNILNNKNLAIMKISNILGL